MRIWPISLFKPRPAPEAKAIVISDGWDQVSDWLANGAGLSRADALRIPAVANAIQIISEAVASLDVMVKRVEGGVEVDAPGHPVLPLLRDEANDWTTGFEVIRQIVVDALTSDLGGMVYVNRPSGQPIELIRYVPGVLTFERDTNTNERIYRRFGSLIPARDVIHLLPPLGRSPLTLAMNAIGIAAALDRHAAGLFGKGARPSGILKVPAMGPEAVTTAREVWNETHGDGQTGRTAVLVNGVEWVPLTMTSTDAEFLENRRFQIAEIARAFNMPAPMLGDLERATWSNSEQKGREFLSYTLEPWLRALEGALRRALFSDAERATHVIRFDRDDLTRADLSTRATVINSLIASRTINPNEGRGWLGLPPRVGGDEYANPNTGSNQPAPVPAGKDDADATE